MRAFILSLLFVGQLIHESGRPGFAAFLFPADGKGLEYLPQASHANS
jgi:hypothetical protein